MSDTKQLTIMKRLTTLLEAVNPVAIVGSTYDLRGRVFRGRTVIGATETPPFVTILESLRPDPLPLAAGNEKMIREESWELLIQGWAVTDTVNPTDALYDLKGTLEKQLARVVLLDHQGSPTYPADYRLGRLITSMRIGPGVVRAATPQTGGTEALYLPLLVGYKVDVSDPWALS